MFALVVDVKKHASTAAQGLVGAIASPGMWEKCAPWCRLEPASQRNDGALRSSTTRQRHVCNVRTSRRWWQTSCSTRSRIECYATKNSQPADCAPKLQSARSRNFTKIDLGCLSCTASSQLSACRARRLRPRPFPARARLFLLCWAQKWVSPAE